jgi:hypothetical protein
VQVNAPTDRSTLSNASTCTPPLAPPSSLPPRRPTCGAQHSFAHRPQPQSSSSPTSQRPTLPCPARTHGPAPHRRACSLPLATAAYQQLARSGSPPPA